MTTSLPVLTAVLSRAPAPEPGLPPACCGQSRAAATTRGRAAPGALPESWCRSVAERCRSAAATRHSRPGSRPAGKPPGRGPAPPHVLEAVLVERGVVGLESPPGAVRGSDVARAAPAV